MNISHRECSIGSRFISVGSGHLEGQAFIWTLVGWSSTMQPILEGHSGIRTYCEDQPYLYPIPPNATSDQIEALKSILT